MKQAWVPPLLLLLCALLSAAAHAESDPEPYGGLEDGAGDGYDGIGPGEDFGQYSDDYGGLGDEDREGPPSDAEKFGAAQHIFGVLELDDLVFDKVVNLSQDILVLFYAEWSVDCKEVMKVLRDAAKLIADHPGCLLAKVNGDVNPKAYNRLKIKEYPTFIKFSKGKKEPEEYKGEHTPDAIISYLTNEEMVGRAEEFEGFVEAFMLHASERERLLELTREQVASSKGEAASCGAYYVKVMENVLKGGIAFVDKEIARLQRLMRAPGVKFEKEQEFRARINVLKVFAGAEGKDEL